MNQINENFFNSCNLKVKKINNSLEVSGFSFVKEIDEIKK